MIIRKVVFLRRQDKALGDPGRSSPGAAAGGPAAPHAGQGESACSLMA